MDQLGKLDVECLVILPSLGNGGTEKVAVLLSEFLARYMVVGLVTFGEKEDDVLTVREPIVRISIGGQSESSSFFRAVISNCRRILLMRRLFVKLKPKVVLSFLPQCNVIAILSSLNTGIRIIVCERNSIRKQDLVKVWFMLRRTVYRWADQVTANSEEIKKELVEDVGCDVAVVQNPLVLPLNVPDIVASEKILLSVGRLVPQKGYDLLIRGYSLSRAGRSGWKLCIVGTGPELIKLQKLARDLSIDGGIVWVGSTNDVEHWYRRSRIFALLSRFEGTSNATLEAMGWARPVIISNTSGGGRELITDGVDGFVIDPNPTMFSETLDWVVDHPTDAQRVGKLGRNRVAKFDHNIVGNQWLKLIRETEC